MKFLKKIFAPFDIGMSLPNQLTVLRMILTPVFAVVLTYNGLHFKYVAFGIFLIASLTDWYDGYAARKLGKTTETGKYLDPLADKLLVSTAFGIFAYLQVIPVWMFFVIAFRDIVITALRAYAISTNKEFETSSLAKWKTASQMTAIYFLLIWIIAREQVGAGSSAFLNFVEELNLVWGVMLFVTLYTLATGVLYAIENRSHLKSLAIACYRVFVPTNVR